MKLKKLICALLAAAFLFTGCARSYGSVRLMENKRIYNEDRSDTLDVLYITAGSAVDQDGKNWTLHDLEEYVGEELDIQLPILMREGTDSQEKVTGGYGYRDGAYNAAIGLRGNTAEPKEKSYKVSINPEKELYHAQNKINLMKYEKDLSRVKTKFYFDLTAYIEDVPGFRTRLVQVKMRQEGGEYQDYGLYTVLEQPNLQYLKGHDFSEDTLIYKAQNFNFSKPDALRSEEDEGYDRAAFEQYLSLSEGSTKHNPLIAVLNALNDEANDIDDVVDTYFSRDNLLSFTALNILLQNTAVVTQDYTLFYRKEDKKWFLAGWNCEKILSSRYQTTKRQKPDSLYSYELFSENVLYRRFFSKKKNIEQLDDRIRQIYGILEKRVDLLTEGYVELVAPQVVKQPDINLLPDTVDLVDDYILSFGKIIGNNYKKYQNSRELPYAFDVQSVSVNGDAVMVKWDKGMNAEDIPFHVNLYKDAACTSLVKESGELTGDNYTFYNLESREYYIRVTAENSVGSQSSRSLYVNPFNQYYYGVERVLVP